MVIALQTVFSTEVGCLSLTQVPVPYDGLGLANEAPLYSLLKSAET